MSLQLSNLQIPPPENYEEFENLCLDLYKLEFGDKTQKNGSHGQSQNGVDISCPALYIGIQCKKKEINKKVTTKELKTEVEKAKKFKPALKRFILATTCKRDSEIQELARLISEEHKKQKLFSVEIHSWDEIKNLFDKYPQVHKKYYSNSASFITPDIISSIQSDSRHQELNKISDLISKDNKPEIALKLLESFKNEKWNQLEDKEKYRVLTSMGYAKIDMKQEVEGSKLLIQALSYNPTDENSNFNCALAYYILGDIKKSKEYVNKTKQKNPLNINAWTLEIQIKDKEKQALTEITSSIPENLKTEIQIAHVLSHINIKRKEHKEAEKWLNIFYTNIEKRDSWENIVATAYYAEMSLSLILERQDVFSGRRIPDSLKNKLLKLIEIYKELITNEKYNEIKKFNPNWYLHYAITLELNEEIDEAISILEESIRNFPEDNAFKIELGRLVFLEKGNIKKNISILENQLGLQISSESTDNTLLNIDQISLSDKTFYFALRLTDLYFQNNQLKNAYKLLNSIEENESLNEENKLEVKQYKIFRFISFKKIDKAEQLLKPLFEKNQNDIMNLILCSKISAFKENLSTGEISKTHRNKRIQYLKRAYDTFKNKKYDQKFINSFGYEQRKRSGDIQQLSQELYVAKMDKESESLLEEITNNNLNHLDIFKLLHVYFENGKNKQAIDLAKKLFEKFPKRIDPINTLFLIYESLGDRNTAIQYYEKFFEKNPENNFIRIELALAYIRNQNISKVENILEAPFNLDELSGEQIVRLSFSYRAIGAIRKALEILYKYINKKLKELEPQNAYFSLITFLNHPYELQNQDNLSNTLKLKDSKPDKSFLYPKKIEIDCYVLIKDIKSLEKTDLIIEEDADIYTPNHEFSKAFLGKKKEEVILFQGKTYQIIEIKSKYIHKYQEIIKETEKKYPSKPFVKSFSIPTKPNKKQLEEAFQKIQPNISKQYEDLDKLFDLYSEGKATIGSIAKLSHKHSIEIIGELITSNKYKFISAIPQWDDCENTKSILNNTTNILIDISSLITIHQLKMEKYIEKSNFKNFVCQSTIDSLKEYIQKISLHSKDGHLTVGFNKEGSLRKSFISAEVIKKDLNFWMQVKTWAEDYCSIKSLSEGYILSRKEKIQRENTLGKDFFDSLLAIDNNFILLCEDANLRKFAEIEYSISGVRLFDFIEFFERQAIIDHSQAIQFKAQLIHLNQTYIPIDYKVLLDLLKSADYSVTNIGFQRGLYFLSNVSDLKGATQLIADFLIEICQEPSLLPYRRQITVKEVLEKASIGRSEHSKEIANLVIHLVKIHTRLLPFLQNEICEYIKEWLRGKVY